MNNRKPLCRFKEALKSNKNAKKKIFLDTNLVLCYLIYNVIYKGCDKDSSRKEKPQRAGEGVSPVRNTLR